MADELSNRAAGSWPTTTFGLIGVVDILGTPITIIDSKKLLRCFEHWLTRDRFRQDHYIVFRDVHGVIRARKERELHDAHEKADVVAADGVPIVWVAHRY